MEDPYYRQVETVIKSRRTVKPNAMNGRVIPQDVILQLLSLADWAPTHGHTEPWHFFVYQGEALKQFGQTHADLYWQHTSEDKRMQATYEKLQRTVEGPSHLIITVMKRGTNPKIPALEEIAATSAAIQNLLLGATALGIASFWNTGGMTHKTALKEHLELGAEDVVMGLIYLGYTDEAPKEAKRLIPLEAKITIKG